MGIDLFQSRNGYQRSKWYKGVVTNGNKLTRSDTVQGVIYLRDAGENTIENVRVSDVQGIQQTLTLETPDSTDIAVNDFVLYEEAYWIVYGLNPKDIDKTKEFSRNASKHTKINVRKIA